MATTADRMAPNPADKPKSSWTWRIGVFALIGVLLAVVVGVVAVTLARYDIVGKLPGFSTFMSTMPVALASGVIGLIGIIVGVVRKSGPKWPAMLAFLLALAMAAVAYFVVLVPAQSAPPLHDITTNVDSPPQFSAITLREDNLIPFQTTEEWQAAHRTGYPNLAPVLVNKSPDEVLGSARVLAEDRGWTIVNVDAEAGRLEAIAYAGFIRFHDDVVIQVTPVEDGSTRVDMRSVSEVGLSDLGYNAARIREFLGALRAAN